MKYKIIYAGFCLVLLCGFAATAYGQNIAKAECVEDLVIGQNVLTQENKVEQASKTLKVSNVVFKGGKVTYQAGKKIVLSEFRAKGGSRVVLRIVPCANASTKAETLLNARSADIGINHLQLYPNPTKSSFVIALPLKPNAQKANSQLVEVYSLLGTTVLKKNVKPGEKIAIDLTNKPKGIYLVKYVTNGEVIIKKVIHQ